MKVFGIFCLNLADLAWMGDESSCRKAWLNTHTYTNTQAQRQMDATIMLKGQNWPQVKILLNSEWSKSIRWFQRYALWPMGMPMCVKWDQDAAQLQQRQFHWTSNGENSCNSFKVWTPFVPSLTSFWTMGSPYEAKGQIIMTLHNYRPRLFHRTPDGVNPSSVFRDMSSAKSELQWYQIGQDFGPQICLPQILEPATRPSGHPEWYNITPLAPKGWGVKWQCMWRN